MSAQLLLEQARKWVGYNEGRGNRTPFGAWYGLDGQPWCDMWVSYVAHVAGLGSLVGRFAYTPTHAKWFREQGRYDKTPRVGSIVFYRWPGMGRISHVGIVEAVHKDGTFTAIEGNTNALGTSRTGGAVQRVRRVMTYVDGFGHPNYPPAAAAPAAPAGPALNDMGNSYRLVEDEDFGGKTAARLQESLNRTGARPRLAYIGISYPRAERLGNRLDVGTRKALQRRLNHLERAAGRAGVKDDGDFGPKSTKALQRNIGANPDGDWGPRTTGRLQYTLNRREL